MYPAFPGELAPSPGGAWLMQENLCCHLAPKGAGRQAHPVPRPKPSTGHVLPA